tara:strand:+ start:73 stop:318 length:246 start_codon:yes stop_codon:yes gene_type:complete
MPAWSSAAAGAKAAAKTKGKKKGEGLSDEEKRRRKWEELILKSMTRKKEGGYNKGPSAAQLAAWGTTRGKKRGKNLKIKDD